MEYTTPVATLTQIELAERLQRRWLEHMDAMFVAGTITSTDMATLSRVLLANGWSLDKSKLPTKLREKLTENMDLSDPDVRQELGLVA